MEVSVIDMESYYWGGVHGLCASKGDAARDPCNFPGLPPAKNLQRPVNVEAG